MVYIEMETNVSAELDPFVDRKTDAPTNIHPAAILVNHDFEHIQPQ